MKFAYADPPYPRMAHRYPENTEVDHRALIRLLVNEYPDGWALSTNTPNLDFVLSLMGEHDLYMAKGHYRVCAWVKPFAIYKPHVGVAYAWEPVIVRGGRKRSRQQPTVRDWVSANISLKKGIVGAKPDPFYSWLLDVLNVQDGDELDDLFPGTYGLDRVRRDESIMGDLIDESPSPKGAGDE